MEPKHVRHKARQKHRQNATTGTPKLKPMEKPSNTYATRIVGTWRDETINNR